MTVVAPREAGFALITALWASVILALLVALVVEASRSVTGAGHAAVRSAENHAFAEGVLATTELTLLGKAASNITLDGTPATRREGDYLVSVAAQDQAGLIDLNFTDERSLFRLVTIDGGFEDTSARALVDRILDWRESGVGRRLNGAKPLEYAGAGYDYGPRLAPFESLAELKLVMGVNAMTFDRIAAALTVYAQRPFVDPMFAPRQVLITLPNMTAESVDAALNERRRRTAGGSSVLAFPGGLTGRSVAITVSADRGREDRVEVSEVIRLTGNPEIPIIRYGCVE